MEVFKLVQTSRQIGVVRFLLSFDFEYKNYYPISFNIHTCSGFDSVDYLNIIKRDYVAATV